VIRDPGKGTLKGLHRTCRPRSNIDPQCRRHQNILFWQMLKDFVPPAWVQQVVVVADAGFTANATLTLRLRACQKSGKRIVGCSSIAAWNHDTPILPT